MNKAAAEMGQLSPKVDALTEKFRVALSRTEENLNALKRFEHLSPDEKASLSLSLGVKHQDPWSAQSSTEAYIHQVFKQQATSLKLHIKEARQGIKKQLDAIGLVEAHYMKTAAALLGTTVSGLPELDYRWVQVARKLKNELESIDADPAHFALFQQYILQAVQTTQTIANTIADIEINLNGYTEACYEKALTNPLSEGGWMSDRLTHLQAYLEEVETAKSTLEESIMSSRWRISEEQRKVKAFLARVGKSGRKWGSEALAEIKERVGYCIGLFEWEA